MSEPDPSLKRDSSQVGDLAWDAVARRIAAGAVAILPIGAGAKQHGFHLPMRSDAIQAEWLSARLAEHVPALIWPVVTYGHYPAFVDYAGSCSLSAPLFEALVRELVTGLLGYGVDGVIVLDTGISTIPPIDRVIAAVLPPGRVLHLEVYGGPRYRSAAALAKQVHGGHADEIETACLLALAPKMVVMDRALASDTRPPGPGPMQHADPGAANYSASGSIGDPGAATAAQGEIVLAAMVADMLDTVAAWRPARA
jgi:creatinine amidohydrolase